MDAPRISVVVPTYDRPARLADCLAALARQDYRQPWEVVVVDDGSPEPAPVAAAVEKVRSAMDVRLVTQANAGPAAARNRGASEARFEFLAFTDDDCLPRPDWLTALSNALKAAPEALHGGRVTNGLPDLVCSEASHQLVEYVVEYFLQTDKCFFPTNNVAMARATFEAIGGFDTGFHLAAGEDRDFSGKLTARGVPLRPQPTAVVEHRHALHLRSFLRQHFNYGRGAFAYRQREEARKASPGRVEPPGFYHNLLREPFRDGRPTRARLRVALLLFLSQVANAAGYFCERAVASLPGSHGERRANGG